MLDRACRGVVAGVRAAAATSVGMIKELRWAWHQAGHLLRDHSPKPEEPWVPPPGEGYAGVTLKDPHER